MSEFEEDYYDDGEIPKTPYDIAQTIVSGLPQKDRINLANTILDSIYYSHEQRDVYPALFRERVTDEERELLKRVLSVVRIAGMPITSEDFVRVVPNLVAVVKYPCPHCKELLDDWTEHEDNHGGWKCQKKTGSEIE